MSTVLALIIGAVVVILAVAVFLRVTSIGFPNPFAETAHENPNAVVLAELKDQSRFVSATGRFQTLIDAEQDADYLPDALKGSRELFIAEGEVEAGTEFSGLTEDAIQISPDGKTLTVHVPPAQLSPPRIDTGATRLVSRERGVLDRLGDALGSGDPTNQQALYQRAEQKISEAAQKSELPARAEANTTQFLRSLFQGMGYQNVEVVFDGPPAAQR